MSGDSPLLACCQVWSETETVKYNTMTTTRATAFNHLHLRWSVNAVIERVIRVIRNRKTMPSQNPPINIKSLAQRVVSNCHLHTMPGAWTTSAATRVHNHAMINGFSRPWCFIRCGATRPHNHAMADHTLINVFARPWCFNRCAATRPHNHARYGRWAFTVLLL